MPSSLTPGGFPGTVRLDFNCLSNCSLYRALECPAGVPSCASPSANGTTPLPETSALVELYMSTSGASWLSNSGWMDARQGSDPCTDSW